MCKPIAVVGLFLVSGVLSFDLVAHVLGGNELTRSRRDADEPPPADEPPFKKFFKHHMFCCEYENDFDRRVAHGLMNRTRECYREQIKLKDKNAFEIFNPFKCEDMAAMKEMVICNYNCVLNKLDVYSDQGEFNADTLKVHLKTILGEDSPSAALADKVVDECVSKVSEDSMNAQVVTCSELPVRMVHCVWRDLTTSCPAEKVVTNKRCDVMRTFFGKKSYDNIDNVLMDGVFLVRGLLFNAL